MKPARKLAIVVSEKLALAHTGLNRMAHLWHTTAQDFSSAARR